MRAIRVEDAVGTVLCHDLTKIVPGECKEPAFRKGQIITEKDIPELLIYFPDINMGYGQIPYLYLGSKKRTGT